MRLSDGGERREQLGRREGVVPGIADLAVLGAVGGLPVLAAEVDGRMTLMVGFSGPRQGGELEDL